LRYGNFASAMDKFRVACVVIVTVKREPAASIDRSLSAHGRSV
jgi:hypothetical protein